MPESNPTLTTYEPVDLEIKKADFLVVNCGDLRFPKAYREVIDNLGGYFDTITVPGASKGIVDYEEPLEYMDVYLGLHGYDTVHIMDHIECGKFGPVDDEQKAHSESIKAAREKIQKAFPQLSVIGHLLGKDGELAVEL